MNDKWGACMAPHDASGAPLAGERHGYRECTDCDLVRSLTLAREQMFCRAWRRVGGMARATCLDRSRRLKPWQRIRRQAAMMVSLLPYQSSACIGVFN